jgi:parallel beta-helix repeat protein
MKPTRLAFAVASVLGGCLAFAAGPALADTLVVHTPTDTTCGAGSPFTTIQSAVIAANSGDNINVCPGTYPEQVTVPAGKDNLTLVSIKPLQAIIQAPAVMVPPKSIVRVNGAKQTRIRDFTITGPGSAGCDSIEYGVRVDTGGSAEIEGNHITKIEDTPFSGCQNGVAIQVGRDGTDSAPPDVTTGSASIHDNLIDNYQKNGITIANAGSSGAIEDNVVNGVGPTDQIAQNGIQISDGANAAVTGNHVSGNAFSPQTVASTGILLFSSGPAFVSGNDAQANDVGIFAISTDRHTTLTENRASQSSFDGIALDAANGSTVNDNNSSNNTAAAGEGFGVFETTGAFLGDNTARNNATNGFLADSASTNNTFERNQAQGNMLDCNDQSHGTGTAMTANQWIRDQGVTSSPMGICQGREHGDGGGDRGDHRHEQPNASH